MDQTRHQTCTSWGGEIFTLMLRWGTLLAIMASLALACPDLGDLAPDADYYGHPVYNSGPPRPPAFERVPPAELEAAVAEIKALSRIQNPVLSSPPILRGLRSSAPTVEEVGPNIALSGVQNFGVFRVSTSEGPLALKLSSKHTAQELRYAFVVQQVLSKLDLAPRIEGIYDGPQLQKMVDRFHIEEKLPEVQRNGEPLVGIAMEEIAGGWNFRVNHEMPPAWAAQLDREAVIGQMQQIGQVLDAMGVKAMDPQFMITPDSKVRLIDLDLFLIRSDRGWLGKQEEKSVPKKPGNDFQDILTTFKRLHLQLQQGNRRRKNTPGT